MFATRTEYEIPRGAVIIADPEYADAAVLALELIAQKHGLTYEQVAASQSSVGALDDEGGLHFDIIWKGKLLGSTRIVAHSWRLK